MGDLTRGLNFTESAPDNRVTADRLHALVEDATLTPAAISGKEAITSLTSGDIFLVRQGSSGELKKVDYAYFTSSPLGLVGFRNLVIKNNSGSPTTTVDITADEVMLRDSNDVLLRSISVNVSANITVSGSNGRDTGSEIGSTWYYIWLISNGSITACLLSTSATAPTMPSGYDYKARIGGVYNDGSANFWTFQQNDDDYTVVRQVNTPTLDITTTNTDPTSSTGYLTLALDGSSLKPFIPTTAYRVRGYIGRTDANVCNLIISGSTGGLGANAIVTQNVGTSTDGFTSAGHFDVPIATAQTVYIKSATDSGVPTNQIRITVNGFKIKP